MRDAKQYPPRHAPLQQCDSSKIHPSSLGQKGHFGGEGCRSREKNLFLPLPIHLLPLSPPRKHKVVCNTCKTYTAWARLCKGALVLSCFWGCKQVIFTVLLWVRCLWTSERTTALIYRPAHKGRTQAWIMGSLVLNLKQEGCAGLIGVIAEYNAPFQRKLRSHLVKS